jgi:hypothetical protein
MAAATAALRGSSLAACGCSSCCAALRALARAIAASTAALRGSTGFWLCGRRLLPALRALARAIAASTAALRGSTLHFRLTFALYARLTGASLRLTRFAGGNRFAVIRFLAGRDHHRLAASLFLANARQCGVNRILIFLARLNGGLLMAFLTGDFSRSSRA